MENEQTQRDESAGGLARRGLLAAGLGSVAATLAPLVQRASASTPPGSDTAGSGPAESTTTTAPLRPTDEDTTLLAGAQSLELAAEALYQMAVSGKALDAVASGVLMAIRQNHEAYGQAISGLLGRAAPGLTDQALVNKHKSVFSGSDSKALLQAAYDLEASLAQTHAELIGKLKSVSGARVLASIAVVEARHGTVLADLMKMTNLDDLLAPEGATLSVKG